MSIVLTILLALPAIVFNTYWMFFMEPLYYHEVSNRSNPIRLYMFLIMPTLLIYYAFTQSMFWGAFYAVAVYSPTIITVLLFCGVDIDEVFGDRRTAYVLPCRAAYLAFIIVGSLFFYDFYAKNGSHESRDANDQKLEIVGKALDKAIGSPFVLPDGDIGHVSQEEISRLRREIAELRDKIKGLEHEPSTNEKAEKPSTVDKLDCVSTTDPNDANNK